MILKMLRSLIRAGAINVRFVLCLPLILLFFSVTLAMEQLCFAAAAASPSVATSNLKLQWFDQDGQSIEVNWKRSSRWTWREQRTRSGSELFPLMEIWIQLPGHIHVAETQDPRIRILHAPKLEDEMEGEILVIEATTPTFTAKLNLSTGPDSNDKPTSAGLLVAVNFDAPQILIHESCLHEGFNLKPIGSPTAPNASAKLFFVGASCVKEKNKLFMEFHLPGEAVAQTTSGVVLMDQKLKISSDSPKAAATKNAKEEKSQPLNGALNTVRILTNGKERSSFQDYKISLGEKETRDKEPRENKEIKVTHEAREPSERETRSDRTAPSNNSSAPLSREQALEVKRKAKREIKKDSASEINFGAGLSSSYISYNAAPDHTADFSPGESIMEAFLHIAYSPSESGGFPFPWETQLNLPILPLLPHPFHYLASGMYSLDSQAQIGTQFRYDNTAFRFLVGLIMEGIHLRERADAPGFAAGPEVVMAFANQRSSWLDERAYDARIGFSPLVAVGASPFFNSFSVFGTFNLELSKLISGNRIDLTSKIEYQNIHSLDSTAIHFAKVSLGLLLWF